MADRCRGFTLIEFLIVMALLAFVLMGSLAFFNGSMRFLAGGATYIDLSFKTRKAMEMMIKDIMLAKQIYTSSGGYSSGSNQICLKLNSVDSSGVPTDVDADYDVVVYHLKSGDTTVLQRTVTADGASSRSSGTTDILEDLSSVTFTYNGSPVSDTDLVTLSLTTQDAFINRRLESAFTTKVKLRNKL